MVIKTQSNISDSWLLFNDSSANYYMATMYTKDTMSINNGLDSIKKIKITAYNSLGANPQDSIDQLEIWLSKSNGFVKVPDLYLFPYHKPGQTSYSYNEDLYFDGAIGNNIHSNATFNLINYQAPTDETIYNFGVGDILQYKKIDYPLYRYSYYSDSVINVLNTPNGNAITVFQTAYAPVNSYPNSSYSLTSGINTYEQFFQYVPQNYIPEKVPNTWYLRYNPRDNFYGDTDKSYDFRFSGIMNFGGEYYINVFPTCTGVDRVKMFNGLGHLKVDECSDATGPIAWELYLTYARKGNHSYGTYVPLGIDNIPNQSPISVFPNPAQNEIQISLPSSKKTSITITDITGQIILQQNVSNDKVSVNVSILSNGIYFLQLKNEDGALRQKIEIVH